MAVKYYKNKNEREKIWGDCTVFIFINLTYKFKNKPELSASMTGKRIESNNHKLSSKEGGRKHRAPLPVTHTQ